MTAKNFGTVESTSTVKSKIGFSAGGVADVDGGGVAAIAFPQMGQFMGLPDNVTAGISKQLPQEQETRMDGDVDGAEDDTEDGAGDGVGAWEGTVDIVGNVGLAAWMRVSFFGCGK